MRIGSKILMFLVPVAVVVALVVDHPQSPRAQTTPGTSELLRTVFSRMPADANVAVAADLSAINTVAPWLAGFSLTDPAGAVQSALNATLSRRYGFTSNPTALGLYMGIEEDFFAIVAMGPTVVPTTIPDMFVYRGWPLSRDGDVVLLVMSDGFVIGSLEGVTGVVDAMMGATISVAASADASAHLAARGGGEALIVFLSGEAMEEVVDDMDLSGMAPPSLLSASLSASLTQLSATFPDATTALAADGLVTLALGQLTEVVTTLQAQADGAESFVEELGLRLAGTALTQSFEGLVTHTVSDRLLDIRIAGPPTTSWLGMWAAIAIPAFSRYETRSMTTEATMNVRRLYDSSVSYYDSDHVDMTGAILAPQFPVSVPLTPPLVPCGDAAYPEAAHWYQPTWQALNFALSDPHYFSYQYDSSGVGPGSTFTASAFGDLDCDGVYSTFLRVGEVDEHNEVRGGAGLYQMNELE